MEMGITEIVLSHKYRLLMERRCLHGDTNKHKNIIIR